MKRVHCYVWNLTWACWGELSHRSGTARRLQRVDPPARRLQRVDSPAIPGSDFYDIITLPDHTWFLAAAHISGDFLEDRQSPRRYREVAV